jgi:hypothetical protein
MRQSRAATLGLALLMSTVTASLANPEQRRLDAACAAYDDHVLTLIEDHGLVGDTAPEVLSEAAWRMVDARLACREGDAKRAFQIYASIPLHGVPPLLHRVLLD